MIEHSKNNRLCAPRVLRRCIAQHQEQMFACFDGVRVKLGMVAFGLAVGFAGTGSAASPIDLIKDFVDPICSADGTPAKRKAEFQSLGWNTVDVATSEQLQTLLTAKTILPTWAQTGQEPTAEEIEGITASIVNHQTRTAPFAIKSVFLAAPAAEHAFVHVGFVNMGDYDHALVEMFALRQPSCVFTASSATYTPPFASSRQAHGVSTYFKFGSTGFDPGSKLTTVSVINAADDMLTHLSIPSNSSITTAVW